MNPREGEHLAYRSVGRAFPIASVGTQSLAPVYPSMSTKGHHGIAAPRLEPSLPSPAALEPGIASRSGSQDPEKDQNSWGQEVAMREAILWVADAPAMAVALARALTETLGQPARPFPLSASHLPPGPALLELRAPGAALRLRAAVRSRTFPLSVITTNPTSLEAWVIGELGLEGVIDKQEPWPRFVERVEALLRGEPAWSLHSWTARQAFEPAWGRRLRSLSPADWQRWRDLTTGLPMKALACRWGLSRQGAAKGLLRLYRRLGVADRWAAALLAHELGIVRFEEGRIGWSEAIEAYLAGREPALLSQRSTSAAVSALAGMLPHEPP
jgi:DNA-binding NarL/FixJ family response regulator